MPVLTTNEAWRAVRELNQALVAHREGGSWLAPRAENLPPEEGEQLIRAATVAGSKAIPAILAYALHPTLGRTALDGVLLVLETSRAMDRLWLDRRVRKSPGWMRYEKLGGGRLTSGLSVKLDPKRLERVLGRSIPPAGWWLLSMAPDGHVRERAVKQISGDGDVRSLSHVLIRSLDWVEQVRRHAVKVYLSSLPKVAPVDLVALAPAIAHLSAGIWWRGPGYSTPYFARLEPEVVAQFGAAFAGEAGTAILLKAVVRAGMAEARASFGLLETGGVDPPVLIESALRSRDVVIQRKALGIAQHVDPNVRADFLRQALRSPFAEVRGLALSGLVEDSLDPAGVLEAALFDQAESVRSLARFLMRRAGIDPLPFYRAVLRPSESARRIAAALLAFADLEHNWIAAVDRLSDARPQVRGAAAIAIGRSDGDVAREVLPKVLADPSPAVSSAARLGLDRSGPIEFGVLTVPLQDPRPHVYRNAARLLHRTGVWFWLVGALELAQSEETDRADLGLGQLLRWGARLYIPHAGPPVELHERLAKAAIGVAMLPDRVVDSFMHYRITLPTYRNVLAGTHESVDVTARNVDSACALKLVQRYRGSRGGWHFTNESATAGYAEAVYVQKNQNYDALAEPDFHDYPTLVYVMASSRSDRRLDQLAGAGLSTLRVEDARLPLRPGTWKT